MTASTATPASCTSSENSSDIRRVAILFSGGPAPAANAVISAAAISFLGAGREVIGFFHGYSNLQDYHAIANPLQPDVHYRKLEQKDLQGLRNSRGIVLGTSRANPGAAIEKLSDLGNEKKNQQLSNVYKALVDLKIDALISIGGDDTLRTANLLLRFQDQHPEAAKRIRIVHLPKTIDNDYSGIDFTFGYFTAVDVMAREIQNLSADAQATSSYFVVETMGRKAGWLSYGVAIAGEAHAVVSVEDIGHLIPTRSSKSKTLDLDKLAQYVVDLIVRREEQHNRHFGVVVIAEGLAERLPAAQHSDLSKDEHGHIALGHVGLGKRLASIVMERYQQQRGAKKKIKSVQLGYESRCAPPQAFDVMLASQLGIGAFRGLIEEGLDGHMVSVVGQLDLHYVPFADLIDEQTLRASVRYIKPGSDFHRLARFLESNTETSSGWTPGPRREQ